MMPCIWSLTGSAGLIFKKQEEVKCCRSGIRARKGLEEAEATRVKLYVLASKDATAQTREMILDAAEHLRL
jgi:hypothetical protein